MLTDDNSDVSLLIIKSTGHKTADCVIDDRYALHLQVLRFILLTTITTRHDQLMITPEAEFSKYIINIFHFVKFVFKFKNAKSCKHDMHSVQQNQMYFILNTEACI